MASELPLDVTLVEGEMEICGFKTKGFRFFAILMFLLISLNISVTIAIIYGRGFDYALVFKDLALVAFGVFTGKKM